MIKKAHFPKIYEWYHRFATIDSKEHYELSWKSKIWFFYTCSRDHCQIECLEYIPKSLEIINIGSERKKETLSQFNERHPKEQLDFKCNCHGLAFANGQFTLPNYSVGEILKEEYIEVTDQAEISSGNYQIISLFNELNQEWIHSIIHQNGQFFHKPGIRAASSCSQLSKILEDGDYKNSAPHYFRRINQHCSGLCAQSPGQLSPTML